MSYPAARHVFHIPTSGTDAVAAWREATGEPVFDFGAGAIEGDGFWFLSIKRRFRKWLQATSNAEITVYHDGMGSDCLGPMDPCRHKLMAIHKFYPRWKQGFEWMIRFTGKVVTGNSEQSKWIKTSFPWIPDKYILTQRQPGLGIALARRGESQGRPRTGIWLHGQNWKRYGNVLRRVADQWPDNLGELEIVCSGRKGFTGKNQQNPIWSIGLPLEFALLRLYLWDSILLLNDFSLQSPMLLKALDLGLFPLVPNGENRERAAAWTKNDAPRSYDWGDYIDASGILRQWRGDREELETKFANWVGTLQHQEVANDFPGEWNALKQTVIQQRPPNLRVWKPARGWMPITWYERMHRLRSGC